MTPAARVATAIELIDRIDAGAPAEKVLTNWARSARHAGSKDRAAIRDHVFDVLRRWWSTAAEGGAATGRGRMIGLMRQQGIAPETMFTGQTYAPAIIEPGEGVAWPMDGPVALDCPGWLEPSMRRALGADFAAIMDRLRHRAPLHLRVNLRKTDRAGAIASLATDGIRAVDGPLSPTCLEVVDNARAVQRSRAYLDGLVEMQDAASQRICDLLPVRDGQRVLDYCAGGGGKALSILGRADIAMDAHDIDASRMAGLPARADRAGVTVRIVDRSALRSGDYDLVLVDAPCSGSGAWRRNPEGKLRLDAARLTELQRLQSKILRQASALVARDGVLAYATCSLLAEENDAIVDGFLADSPSWHPVLRRRLTPLEGGDGFYVALMSQRQAF
ncbi:putative NOL1/NOP2/sun family protein [Oceaniovalibus guishaninsula JLT2003]|uniref:Putative NOL1/NOP2/sun family protein n=1 Tax=Oceaniovalibus guishaninsula JLT2003 TaxID=1231392 RepID=K2I3T9_9RHOB|nr:RsmB/NOP family class I SAM-dependent RNA methyltransferase [Oceaniovalibus guishaninsula]EKE43530.1 putative NOL1/NOP2/sun family protein [Oceaniovalibus guishaninsula JLT2003]